jgi:ferredoxin-type protein NapF
VDGDGGFPEIDFARGECTFCGACSAACLASIFDTDAQRAWTLTARVGGNCLSARGIVCRSCVDACAEKAITITPARGGSAKPRVVAAVCTGCGACVSVCPVRAIGVQASAEVTDAA